MSTEPSTPLPRLLHVGGSAAVRMALAAHQGMRYERYPAVSGEAALHALEHHGPFALIVAEMNAPGLAAATWLDAARRSFPDTVRVLLGDFNDVASLVTAVNAGQVFRALRTPCAADTLLEAVDEALLQHQALVDQRDRLDRTQRGAVQALAEVLALARPEAFSAASRTRRLALALAERCGLHPSWPLELAALVSRIGTISLPLETAARVRYGDPLAEDEQSMLARVPEIAQRVLAPIPGMDEVGEILRESRHAPAPLPQLGSNELRQMLTAAAILRLVEAYEQLESKGHSAGAALAELRAARPAHAPELLTYLGEITRHEIENRLEVRELPLRFLRTGMVLAEDLRNRHGLLLARRGSEVSAGLVEHARSFPAGWVREPVRVVLRDEAVLAAAESFPASKDRRAA